MPQLVHGRRRSSSSGKFATEDLRANPRWPRLGPADDARHKGELAAQLQVTLESRVLIEQAKGVLIERHGLDDQKAFARLCRYRRTRLSSTVSTTEATTENRIMNRQPGQPPKGRICARPGRMRFPLLYPWELTGGWVWPSAEPWLGALAAGRGSWPCDDTERTARPSQE